MDTYIDIYDNLNYNNNVADYLNSLYNLATVSGNGIKIVED